MEDGHQVASGKGYHRLSRYSVRPHITGYSLKPINNFPFPRLFLYHPSCHLKTGNENASCVPGQTHRTGQPEHPAVFSTSAFFCGACIVVISSGLSQSNHYSRWDVL